MSEEKTYRLEVPDYEVGYARTWLIGNGRDLDSFLDGKDPVTKLLFKVVPRSWLGNMTGGGADKEAFGKQLREAIANEDSRLLTALVVLVLELRNFACYPELEA